MLGIHMEFPVSADAELDAAARRRIALNQATLRMVNEGIDADRERPRLAFVCECGRVGCNQLIMMARADYDAVRADPRRFVVAPGHGVAALERVVERHDTYVVVETLPHVRDVAESTDPRGLATG